VFRGAHFFSFFALSCYISLCSKFRVAHFFSFFVLSCYVSVCSEFRVAHFIKNVCVFLLCIFMFWVPCCSFHNFCLCCPVMYLYVLSSVLLISLVFSWCPVMYLYVLSSVLLISLFVFVLSCYVSVCSEFRVAHFFSFCCVVLLCIFMFWVPCCSFLYLLCVVLLFVFMFWIPCCLIL
jgi:hypothetical protein